jgi:hypothetical protein
LLEANGVFVLEKRPEENLPPIPLWHVVRAKKYGATEVLFLTPVRLGPIRNPVSEIE